MRWLQLLLSCMVLVVVAPASTLGKGWRGIGRQNRKDTQEEPSPDHTKKDEPKVRRWSWRSLSRKPKEESDQKTNEKTTAPTKQPQEPPAAAKPVKPEEVPSSEPASSPGDDTDFVWPPLFPRRGKTAKTPSTKRGSKTEEPTEQKHDKALSEQEGKDASAVNNSTGTQTESENASGTIQSTLTSDSSSDESSSTNTTDTTPTQTAPETPSPENGGDLPPEGMSSHQVIVLGGPSSGPRHSPFFQQHLQQQQLLQQQQQLRTTIAAAEVFAPLLASITRLGIVMWATRWVANRQESIHPTQHFVFERLNDKYIRDARALQTAIDAPPSGVSGARWRRQLFQRQRHRIPRLFQRPFLLKNLFVKTVLVLDIGNDGKGSIDLDHLTDVVSFLLMQHRAHAFGSTRHKVEHDDGSIHTVVQPVELEVVLRVDSPGGSVATFGLAASQILRLRNEDGIVTTVCVDKYAASGGYMIASQADKMYAAPFATVGSVGVIMEALNYHELLKNYGVQPLVVKAGNAKNPLTTYGEVTKEGLKMEQERLDKVHEAFQKFTIRGRPQLTGMERQVCDGSVYMGEDALALKLIDGIMTSDEYLMERIQAGDRVLKLHRSHQSRMSPHLRFPTPIDILPHLRGWLGKWAVSVDPADMAAKAVQMASLLGFVHHLMGKICGK